MNKEDFPIFKKDIIYFDNGATTQKPIQVVNKITDYYISYCSNAHRGDYKTSLIVDTEYENARDIVKDFINAEFRSEIVFTSGTTQSLNMIAEGFFSHILDSEDEILITQSEHASNVLPWYEIAHNKGCKVRFIELDENHKVTIENVKKAITNKTKVISLAQITNVLGDIRPIKEISKIAHEKDIKVLVDGAQAISHTKINVMDDDIDFLSASAHKFYGPTGIGFLYAKYDLLEEMEPLFYGGGSNAIFTTDGYIELREIPTRHEAGTQNIAGVIGMGEALKYLSSIGIDEICMHEHDLKKYLIEKLKKFDNVTIYNENNIGSIVTFNIKDIFSQDVAIYLDKNNICIRSGNHCAKIIDSVVNTSNTCRVSFGLYNDFNEIDTLIIKLENISNIWDEIL